ncbi:MAG: hypothetical protein ACJ78Y_12775, partial [Myxococcales bacterium]
MRIGKLCIAACLVVVANLSCGDDDSPPACKPVAACVAAPAVRASPTQACGFANVCADPQGACRKPVVTSSGVTEIPLGTRVVGDVVNFDVPAGTVSITIVEQAKGTGAQTPPDTVTLNG